MRYVASSDIDVSEVVNCSGYSNRFAIMCMRCIVSGRVQGVWFRASTKGYAEDLELTGWVRNLADGRVEVLACGPPDRLQALRDWLKIGPELAEVSGLECQSPTSDHHARGFVIR